MAEPVRLLTIQGPGEVFVLCPLLFRKYRVKALRQITLILLSEHSLESSRLSSSQGLNMHKDQWMAWFCALQFGLRWKNWAPMHCGLSLPHCRVKTSYTSSDHLISKWKRMWAYRTTFLFSDKELVVILDFYAFAKLL